MKARIVPFLFALALPALASPRLDNPVKRLQQGPVDFHCRYVGETLFGHAPQMEFRVSLASVDPNQPPNSGFRGEVKVSNLQFGYSKLEPLSIGDKQITGSLLQAAAGWQALGIDFFYEGPPLPGMMAEGVKRVFSAHWDDESGIVVARYKDILVLERAKDDLSRPASPSHPRPMPMDKEHAAMDYVFLCDPK